MEFKKIDGLIYYGLSVFSLGSGEWVIGTEKQFRIAAEEKVREELWTYNTTYICKFLREKQVFGDSWSNNEWDKFDKALNSIQEQMNEDANPIIITILGLQIDAFVKGVTENIEELGQILGRYDCEIKRTRDTEGLNPGYGPLCFRLN